MHCFSTLYVYDGDLWCSIIHGCLCKPKCRLLLKGVSRPLVCAPHIPAGMLPCGSIAWTWWGLVASQAPSQPALALQGHNGIPTSPPPPAPAQPLGKWGEATASLHFLHVTRLPRLLVQRSLLGSQSLHFSPVLTKLGFPSHFPLLLL